MTSNFTTPQFARDLKEKHGIEIDSPFLSFLLKGEDDPENYTIGMYSKGTGYYVTIDGWTYNEDEVDAESISPAYPLTQVLGWLPEMVIIDGSNCFLFYQGTANSIFYAYQTHEGDEGLYFESIEAIIFQGLSEGWLTKEIIEDQIKAKL